MTPIEKAVARLGGQAETGRLFGVSTQAVHKWVGRGFAPAEHCPRIESLSGVPCEALNDRVDWALIRGTRPAGGVAKPARAEGAPPPAGLICELTAQGAVFARKLADLQQRGYQVLGHILHKDGEYALMDGSCRWLTQPQYQRLMHEQDGSLFAAPVPVDDAAELRRAISETRIVFESEPAAGDALNYLESVLAAGAPVPAQTGMAGGGGASITKETHTSDGAEPVVGAARLAASTTTADQAAGAMAAKSAQLVADAERSVVAREAAFVALVEIVKIVRNLPSHA